MRCPTCDYHNSRDARFCGACGERLAGGCRACGAELAADARFCAGCGAARGEEAEGPAADSPSRGPESRQLTVMFCDLVGSSVISQKLGAESYGEYVGAYHETCVEAVTRYDGYVAQYLGDGVLVYFGYPLAQEDAAERALRAGLDLLGDIRALSERLRATLGTPASIRIGVHTGRVVVGEIGSGGRRETLALGDTPNIAARLQDLAEPNTLVTSESTLRLVSGLFVTRDLGSPRLKGISERLRTVAVEARSGVRGRLDRAAQLTPIVGREAELGQLLAHWNAARRGEAQAVLLGGEPGVGKSRLAAQLRERIADAEPTWLELHCSPFAVSNALAPVVEFLRRHLGFDASESPVESWERLRAGLEPLVPEAAAERLGRLLSLPAPDGAAPPSESGELGRLRTLKALVSLVEAFARRGPVVLVCEDLHWIDPTTLEWLDQLLVRCADLPLLCLLTHRPGFEAAWRASRVAQLPVPRLGPEQARALVAAAARGEVVPEEISRTIVARADGVPLFIEELVKMVMESPAGDDRASMAVPETLQDLLTARLDRLGPAKEVAQLGAVLGRDFSYDLLHEIRGEDEAGLRRGLVKLADSGLVFESGTPPDAVYTFKHALVQDTAYESLLKRQRRELHGRAAAVLEQRSQSGADVAPSLLGHHWSGAAEWLRAAACFDEAGRRAASSAACEEAIAQYQSGLAAAARGPEGAERARRELSLNIMLGNSLMAARGFASPETLPAWLRAVELAQEMDDPVDLPAALHGAASYYITAGDCDTALRYAAAILELAPRGNARIIEMRGQIISAQACYFLGEGQRCFEHAERASTLYRPEDFWGVAYGSSLDQGVNAHGIASLALLWLGRTDDGLARAREAVRLSHQLESPINLASALTYLCIHHIERCEYDALKDVASELSDLATKLGQPAWVGFARMAEGFIRAQHGERDGIDQMLQGVELQGETVGRSGASFGLALLAEAQLQVKEYEAAAGLVAIGLATAQELRQPYHDAQLLLLESDILEAQEPGSEAALAKLRRAHEEARERGARLFQLRAATRWARRLGDAGEGEGARALLREALAGYQGDTEDARAAQRLLAEGA